MLHGSPSTTPQRPLRSPKKLHLDAKGVCAVVGCGPGLGSAVALEFSSQGYDIALCSRSIKSAATALQKIKARGRKALHFPVDVSDKKSVKACFEEVSKQLGDVECLVFNASGPSTQGGILAMDIDVVIQRWNVECLGALLCARAVIPAMLRKSSGSLLFTSATAAFRGSATSPAFSIAKFGLRSLSQSIAKEFGKNGIHACHIRLDCGLNTPKNLKKGYPVEKLGDVTEIAKTYYHLHTQSKMAWTNELDIRPHTEKWTC
mmetsp:Transcript_23851/g.33127  ORF Transcript_23851/g.33127 Transcript_23851/m.33127 type:complete len:261 (-) Transcript_23851:210-992(-)